MKERVRRPYSSKRRVCSLYSAGRLTIPRSSTRLETNRSETCPVVDHFSPSAFDPPDRPRCERAALNNKSTNQLTGKRNERKRENEEREREREREIEKKNGV